MTSQIPSSWKCVEGPIDAVLQRFKRPLDELAAAHVPALIFRKAYSDADCQRLVARLIERELLYDPREPTPAKFLEQSVPEGFFKRGSAQAKEEGFVDDGSKPRRRIDIGTSLGYRGNDQDAFFDHAAETHRIFAKLFDGLRDPVKLLYDHLTAMAPGKQAVTAYEPDGRRYGPAIIRAHYGGYTYKPHIDSVRLREARTNYAVHEFEHQFAGVLVLQNTERDGETAQAILHQCLWEPELEDVLREGRFHDYAAEHRIANVRVELEPGDLYFFNTRCIHEVPGLEGRMPRIVLATFIGYSSDRDKIFVWS